MPTVGNQRELGATVRERRRLFGWTQAELAGRVGVTRDWVIDVEAGRGNPQLRHLLRTLDVLGLSLRVDPTDGGSIGSDATGSAPGQNHQRLPVVNLDALLDEHRRRG